MKKTNFDKYLAEQLKDPEIKMKFKKTSIELDKFEAISALNFILSIIEATELNYDLDFDRKLLNSKIKVLKDIVKRANKI